MPFKVEVTEKDILFGERNKCHRCPVALAIERIRPGYSVKVTQFRVLIGSRGFRLPTEAQRFIESFDKGFEVKPFSFILD